MKDSINILALDTSSTCCSVALQYDGDVKGIYGDELDRSKKLLTMIKQLLHNISLEEIDVLAFAGGPGSFTGLKIGSCIIQGIHLAHNTPIIKISTLEVLALLANEQFGNNKIIPYIDARMGQIYYSFYEFCYQSQVESLLAVSNRAQQDTIGTTKDLLELSKLHPDALLVSNNTDILQGNKVTFTAKSILKVANYHYKKYGIISNNSNNYDPIYLFPYK